MRTALALVLSLLAASAGAGTIVQSGNVTPGHVWGVVTNGVAGDGGPATAGNLTEIGITKNGGNALCVNSGPITGSYQELCMGATTSSGATISLQNLGGAPAEPLTFIVDGVTVLSLSEATSGLVTVSGTPTTGHCAVFTGPTVIGDSGAACGGSGGSIANNTILGNVSGSTAPAVGLTPKQVNTLLKLLDNVVSEGADPTGVTDSTTALNTAIATCGVYIPPGAYKASGNLTTSACTNLTIIGAGSAVTTITATGTNNPILTNGATNGIIQGITFNRSGSPATSGAVGLSMPTVTNQFKLFDLRATNQYVGFLLGPTAWSFADHLASDSNFNDGYLITNTGSGGDLQWQVTNSIAQFNNGWGAQVVSNFSGVVYMLPWYNFSTFANTAGGIQLAGSSGKSIENFQLSGSILGGDGNDSIQLASWGYQPIVITSTQLGSTGLIATGRGAATPATHTGSGITVTGHNSSLNMSQDVIQGASFDGIVIESGALDSCELVNVDSLLNGTANPGAQYHGLSIGTALTCTITGGTYGNRSGGADQYIGIGALTGVGLSFMGVNVPSNVFNGIVMNSNASSAYCNGVQGESMTTIGCNQGSGGGGGSVSITSGNSLLVASPSPITGSGTLTASESPTYTGTVTGSGTPGFAMPNNGAFDLGASAVLSGNGAGVSLTTTGTHLFAVGMNIDPNPTNTYTLGTAGSIWADLQTNTATVASTLTTNITGVSTQCVTANSAGVLSGTGSPCGSSSGAVSITSGNANIVLSPSTITGTGTITMAAAPTFSGTVTGNGTPGFALPNNGAIDLGASAVLSGNGAGVSLTTTGTHLFGVSMNIDPSPTNTYTLGTAGSIWADLQTNTATVASTLTTNITGSTQCVQANSAGVLSGTGSACGSGGGAVSITSGNALLVASPSPITGTGTLTANETPTFTGLVTGSLGFAAPNNEPFDLGATAVLSGNGAGVTLTGTLTDGFVLGMQLVPGTDNTYPLGLSTNRWSDIRGNTETLTGNLTTNITGSTECVQASSTGVLSGTGTTCGSGGGGITTLTGDVTAGPGSGSQAATLATVNSNVGTFQGITVNGKGLVTAAANQSYLTANQTITVSSDCTGSGTTSISITCTKSSGTAFGTAAFDNTGTSGATIPLANGTNTWASAQTFSSGIAVASSQTATFGGSTASIAGSGSGVMTLHSTFSIAADTPSFDPLTTNTTALGASSDTWSMGYITGGVWTGSDQRLKHDIQPADLGLAFIRELRPVSYRWNDEKLGTGKRYGFIAQDLVKELGGREFGGLEAPKTDAEFYHLIYPELIAPTVKAVQELAAANDNQKAQIAQLIAANDELRHRLDRLEHRKGAAR